MGKNNRKSTQPLPNSTVDGETIEILKKTLSLETIDTGNISELIRTLISCVLKLYENVENKTSTPSSSAVETAANAATAATAAATTATAGLRELEDYHDDTCQRFLKGNRCYINAHVLV